MHYSKVVGFVSAAVLFVSQSISYAATGTVTTDGLNIRSGATTDSSIIGSVNTNDTLTITGLVDNYYSLDFNGSEAYASADYVSVNILSSAIVTTDLLNIRTQPTTASNVMGQLVYNDEVFVTDRYDDWYQILIKGVFGYVHSDYISTRDNVPMSSRSSASFSRAGSNVVEYSKQFMGVPYVTGGSSPSGFDCSGFTSYVYRQFGVSLPRTASSQAGAGIEVARGNLVPGDLVFFDTYGGISHVGIFTGGDSFIHATVPGDVVKISSLSSSYYSPRFVTARRVIR